MITKGNIALVDVSLDGLEDFHEYSLKPELYEHLEFNPFTTFDETKHYLEKLIERSNKNTGRYFFIKMVDENKVVGSIGYNEYNTYRKSAEIGYGLSPDYWGKKIFSKASHLLLKHMFFELGVHRVMAKTSICNVPSIKGLLSRGFKQEGQLRDFYFIDGKWIDAVQFSLLSNEFEA